LSRDTNRFLIPSSIRVIRVKQTLFKLFNLRKMFCVLVREERVVELLPVHLLFDSIRLVVNKGDEPLIG
jgi:hypothetical protein